MKSFADPSFISVNNPAGYQENSSARIGSFSKTQNSTTLRKNLSGAMTSIQKFSSNTSQAGKPKCLMNTSNNREIPTSQSKVGSKAGVKKRNLFQSHASSIGPATRNKAPGMN
jgi:hypothetical protein